MTTPNRGLQPLPPPPVPTIGFSTSYRVRTADVDPQSRLRLDSIARYLQDIANDDLEATNHADTDPYWIVRRTVTDVIEPITWPATVHLQRWCSAVSTRWASMRVRLTSEPEPSALNPHQRPAGLVETEAFWIAVNEQGMPTRISPSGFAMLAAMTETHRLRWHGMTPALPAQADDPDALPDRPHVLRSTDFDPLQHLNNAAYLSAVEDELLDHPDLRRHPYRVVIEYLRPIPPGTAVTVRRRRHGGELQMWMSADDRVAAAVVVTSL